MQSTDMEFYAQGQKFISEWKAKAKTSQFAQYFIKNWFGDSKHTP